ncbi:hypothetical protein [Halolamina sp.]|jgi:hypothetical protein|uniref:DUF7511 domain-containing protein n=1 Tax=Halolamina sp. TaxID=1940283 RepID=UPI000223BC42|nr:hypothetical protein Halar_2430 [halophilic archaeon DL31]
MRGQQTQPDELLEPSPEYVLRCRYDDEDNPSEVTVFPGKEGELSTTEWLTANVDSTVALDEVR